MRIPRVGIFIFLRPCPTACQVLIPQSGMEPMPPYTGSTKSFFLLFLNFLFYVLGYSPLINNAVRVSDDYRRDSAIHTYVSILPQMNPGCHIMPGKVPWGARSHSQESPCWGRQAFVLELDMLASQTSVAWPAASNLEDLKTEI